MPSLEQPRKYKMKKILIISLILMILIVVQSLFIGKGAAFGSLVSELDQKIESLKEENQRIEKEIAMLSSCLTIEKKFTNLDLSSLKEISSTNSLANFKVALKP